MSSSATFPAPTPAAVAASIPHGDDSAAASPSSSPGSPRKRSRGTSITESILNARPPLGALAATGEAFGSAPSLADLRRNSVGTVQRRRSSVGRRESSLSGAGFSPMVDRSMPILESHREERRPAAVGSSLGDAALESEKQPRQVGGDGAADEVGSCHDAEDGKPGAWATTKEGLKAFWKWFTTPLGFFITIYMLNVVAWGGMLFLLLCNAAPAMCKPTCDDINSPRRKWIEIDSQILNALFCVTGFGLVPWRFRDLYYLLKWRWGGKQSGHLKLQEINAAWYRPEPAEPTPEDGHIPIVSTEDAGTVTGKRAPPTKSWKLDYVIWLYVWNTFFQCCLCGFMWGMNRYDRPSWSTGLFVALACIVAGMAGGQVWWETRRVKKIEGEEKDKHDGKESVRAPEGADDQGRGQEL